MSTDRRKENIGEVIRLIRKLMQVGEHYSRELHKNYDISAPQLACLLALYEKGPMSPSRIARSIMVSSSTVTGILDRLEAKELVRRVRNPRDRRSITVSLTETGRRLAEIAPPPVQQRIVNGLKRLPDEEFQEILQGLSRLLGLLKMSENANL